MTVVKLIGILLCLFQRAHIHKSIMLVLERDPAEEQRLAEKARKEEDERLAAQQQMQLVRN